MKVMARSHGREFRCGAVKRPLHLDVDGAGYVATIHGWPRKLHSHLFHFDGYY